MKWWLAKLLTCVSLAHFLVICNAFIGTPSNARRRQIPLFLAHKDDVFASIRRCQSAPDVIRLIGDDPDPNTSAMALRRLLDLSMKRRRRRTPTLTIDDETVAQEQIPILFDNIDEAINKDPNELSLLSLIDILTSLSKVSTYERREELANQVCSAIETKASKDSFQNVKPFRLVECLDALAVLEFYPTELLQQMCCRLQNGDALANLKPRDLAVGLKAMAGLEHVHDEVSTTTKCFIRRWRKQQVRQDASNADICRALFAARLLTRQQTDSTESDIDKETTIMVYTLLRELSSPFSSHNVTNSRSLSAGQVAEALITARAFHINASNPSMGQLMQQLQQEWTLKRATATDILRILVSMERLELTQYPLVVQTLGRKFGEVVDIDVEPETLCSILKAILRLHPHEETVLEPFLNATTTLIVYSPNNVFLQRCSHEDLSSLVRFLCLARFDDEQVFARLSNRILEPDIIESCSPRSASQILSYMTMWNAASSKGSELFHELGTSLLSTQLSAAETSSAMQAYAKASYVQDMGIFDHLASHLTTLLQECSVRQVVQSLWACGKMYLWEGDAEQDEDKESAGPPYLEAARQYTSWLASNVSRMNSKDISQVLWAVGRLGCEDENVRNAFALRASQVASECNSLEVVNILWGLSRIGYSDTLVVSILTKRMSELRPTSQEAATVLYALGRMEIRDEETFESMSNAMMGQLESASAQAIANALWAYRTVEIPPPRALMDSWVSQLGIPGVRVNDRIE